MSESNLQMTQRVDVEVIRAADRTDLKDPKETIPESSTDDS